jgi:hypothetical protein
MDADSSPRDARGVGLSQTSESGFSLDPLREQLLDDELLVPAPEDEAELLALEEQEEAKAERTARARWLRGAGITLLLAVVGATVIFFVSRCVPS